MTAFATPEQIALASRANVETALSLINSAIAKAQRLTELNLATARSALEDGVASTTALMAVKDPQELAKVQASLAKPLVEKAVAYVRSVYDIAAEGQEEVFKLIDAQGVELNKTFATVLAQAAKSAPAGSDVAFDAAKSAIAAINGAYDDVSKAARQVSKIAEANVAAATDAALKAVKGLKAA